MKKLPLGQLCYASGALVDMTSIRMLHLLKGVDYDWLIRILPSTSIRYPSTKVQFSLEACFSVGLLTFKKLKRLI
jgi:hypothetical protein